MQQAEFTCERPRSPLNTRDISVRVPVGKGRRWCKHVVAKFLFMDIDYKRLRRGRAPDRIDRDKHAYHANRSKQDESEAFAGEQRQLFTTANALAGDVST